MKCESVYLSCRMTGNHCLFIFVPSAPLPSSLAAATSESFVIKDSQQKVGQRLLKL